ncbi:septum site-determining protein MinC, partial [Bacillus subtilis]
MPQSPIELKGSSFTLSVIHLHSEEPKLIKKALQDKVSQAPDFLKNAPVVINIAELTHHADMY